ncbi:MAG: tetratricopeptide repeat protein [Bacteroidetes bacterium]|nr:tetratricopeptide repeat protein [Bacteroidota bacterium]
MSDNSTASPKPRLSSAALLHRVVFFALLCYAMYPYAGKLSIVYAFFLQLVVVYGLKFIFIPGSSFTAWSRMRQEKYEEAVGYFQKDVEYYTKREWIDKYRAALMISWSTISYREIALCGMAYCLIQNGQVKEGKEVYEFVLKEYPESEAARRSLNAINLIQKEEQ